MSKTHHICKTMQNDFHVHNDNGNSVHIHCMPTESNWKAKFFLHMHQLSCIHIVQNNWLSKQWHNVHIICFANRCWSSITNWLILIDSYCNGILPIWNWIFTWLQLNLTFRLFTLWSINKMLQRHAARLFIIYDLFGRVQLKCSDKNANKNQHTHTYHTHDIKHWTKWDKKNNTVTTSLPFFFPLHRVWICFFMLFYEVCCFVRCIQFEFFGMKFSVETCPYGNIQYATAIKMLNAIFVALDRAVSYKLMIGHLLNTIATLSIDLLNIVLESVICQYWLRKQYVRSVCDIEATYLTNGIFLKATAIFSMRLQMSRNSIECSHEISSPSSDAHTHTHKLNSIE